MRDFPWKHSLSTYKLTLIQMIVLDLWTNAKQVVLLLDVWKYSMADKDLGLQERKNSCLQYLPDIVKQWKWFTFVNSGAMS